MGIRALFGSSLLDYLKMLRILVSYSVSTKINWKQLASHSGNKKFYTILPEGFERNELDGNYFTDPNIHMLKLVEFKLKENPAMAKSY